MDTMLGIDNQGYPRLNYYDEDTNSELFNGNDVLWNFVRDALPGEVVDGYRNFESKSSMFTASTILPYFNNNQADLANEALYNGDAEYKYIDTFRNGYYNHLNTDEDGNPLWIAPGTVSRLYAAQGNRSLDRQYFITNRINFLRGKYESGNYVDGDRIEFRCYNPSPEHRPTLEGKEKTAKSIEAIPFSDEFTLKSLGPGFSGIRIGEHGPVTNRQFNEANQIITFSPDQDPGDTESYILGLNNLSDIGDLSNKYLGTFTVKYPNKLRRIVLGNEHKDYYNPYWKEKTGSIVDVQACSLLEELNMYNCSDYQEQLNLSNCKQLQKILLTGSGVNALTLPEGTVINELRLPDTIPTLTIKNQNFLTPDKFSFGHYDYAENETLMINGQFVNTYNNLEYVEIINTNINSYEIATKSPKLQEYIFTNVNWVADTNDEQYCSVYQEDFNPVIQYYK